MSGDEGYLITTLTSGVERPICTMGPGSTKTHCLHKASSEIWEPPCQMCSVRQFFRHKIKGMTYVAWKGYLVQEEEEDES